MTLHDRELDAMQEILQVLSHLDEDAQRRVTSWVSERVARAGGVVPPEEPEPPIDRNFPKARAFVEVKAPRTKFERLACLVYWATRDHRPDVRLSDIDQLNREVGGEVFSDAGSVAQYTIEKGYLCRSRQGHVALTSAGEKLVASLPIKGLGPTKPDALHESVPRTLRDLLDADVIRPGEPIEWRRPEVGQHHTAAILHEDMIVTGDGRSFSSLSTAASALAGSSCNGWICWTVPRLGGVRIGSLRGQSRR